VVKLIFNIPDYWILIFNRIASYFSEDHIILTLDFYWSFFQNILLNKTYFETNIDHFKYFEFPMSTTHESRVFCLVNRVLKLLDLKISFLVSSIFTKLFDWGSMGDPNSDTRPYISIFILANVNPDLKSDHAYPMEIPFWCANLRNNVLFRHWNPFEQWSRINILAMTKLVRTWESLHYLLMSTSFEHFKFYCFAKMLWKTCWHETVPLNYERNSFA
jgi:hypothetical protein